MKKIEDGGPAFPVPDLGNDGMTLRDWFAGKAPKLSDEQIPSASRMLGIEVPYESKSRPPMDEWRCSWGLHVQAVYAYRYADMMILARKAVPS